MDRGFGRRLTTVPSRGIVAGMRQLRILPTVAIVLGLASFIWAADPKPAAPKPAAAKPKKVIGEGGAPMLPPPATKPIPEKDRAELEAGVAALGKQIDALRGELKSKPKLLELLPDVVIYYNAVKYPLTYNEEMDVKSAKKALADGTARAKDLRDGKTPWVIDGGPRGYLSRVDGSVQPYLMHAPKGLKDGGNKKWQVEFFCHGRSEGLMELRFINGKGEGNNGSPVDRFFIQPYGRYCCANKFAGEIDIHEILESLKRQYAIDEQRVILMGFSMGGAAVWHLAGHYADVWCAASPGAGFCETPIYQKMEEKGELATLPWYEKTLFHWYDMPGYIGNYANCPTIAYAGTLDPQQESGTIMTKAAAEAGVKLDRIWGQNVPHKYEPGAKKELDERLDKLAEQGKPAAPPKVRLQTWTLRYNKIFWVNVDALERHWRQADVNAELTSGGIVARTNNVGAITFAFAHGTCPLSGTPTVEIDGAKLPAPAVGGDKTFAAHYAKVNGAWQPATASESLAKRHGLQGPIDDAFLDTFVFVKPTGQPAHEKAGAWAKSEMDHAVRQWHNIFRGEAPVKPDDQISADDIATSNLVLWGDPSSNKVLAKIADKLPIKWTNDKVTVGDQSYDAATHAPILIYPNPLNPHKYVVINSGFTFREDANGTNSRQVPKLPDYAVVDLTTPPNVHAPGKIVDAGFFGEQWELTKDQPAEAAKRVNVAP